MNKKQYVMFKSYSHIYHHFKITAAVELHRILTEYGIGREYHYERGHLIHDESRFTLFLLECSHCIALISYE